MIKHWSRYLHEQISELERCKHLLATAVRSAEQQAGAYLSMWREEERRRQLLDAELHEMRQALFKEQTENRRLWNLSAEHATLLDELEIVRGELKSERRKTRKLEKELIRRPGREGYFGLATPSALKINKPGSTAENKARQGGAVTGHKGYGRQDFKADEADEVIVIDKTPPPCACGHGTWLPGASREHCVIELVPARKIRKFYLKRECTCSGCGKVETIRTPEVTPGGLYGNGMVAHLLTEHYLHGLTAGNVCRREGVNEGTFFQIAARSADLLKPLFERILLELRTCLIVHADETGWRNNGGRAYGWIFANADFAAFLFRGTRSSKVPLEVFGRDPLNINLITDRYRGYDPLKLNRQYCYVHLLRDLKTLEKEFPDDPEVAAFSAELKPLLKNAIAMYKAKMELTDYVTAATAIKDDIMTVCNKEANHPGIQQFQNIFRKHPERMFQWVKSPDIPAENNFAERGVRPSVIARKISFGSQSERGMLTRELLMTFLYTARMRGLEPKTTLEKALNMLCLDPNADIAPLFGLQTKEQPAKVVA